MGRPLVYELPRVVGDTPGLVAPTRAYSDAEMEARVARRIVTGIDMLPIYPLDEALEKMRFEQLQLIGAFALKYHDNSQVTKLLVSVGLSAEDTDRANLTADEMARVGRGVIIQEMLERIRIEREFADGQHSTT